MQGLMPQVRLVIPHPKPMSWPHRHRPCCVFSRMPCKARPAPSKPTRTAEHQPAYDLSLQGTVTSLKEMFGDPEVTTSFMVQAEARSQMLR